ncbi:MAG: CCA tRNA nucleotidyltransferase [Magnetococcales bacterium]|nr:CCA tRNA nucleotidyltransferase [Magnetococcales bacterium]
MPLTPQAAIPPLVHAVLNEIHRLCHPIYLSGEFLHRCLSNQPLPDELEILTPNSLVELRPKLIQAGLIAANHGMNDHLQHRLLIPIRNQTAPKAIEMTHFTGHVIDDLNVRDITINAMAWCWPNGPLIDPFLGLQDLAQKRIRLVHGLATLEQDPLNALRFFRFMLQLPGEPDAEDWQAIENGSLSHVAKDRLRAEMDQVLTLPLQDSRSQRYLLRLFKTPSGSHILPELANMQNIPHGNDDARTAWDHVMEMTLAIAPPEEGEEVTLLDLRWAALLHEVGRGLPAMMAVDNPAMIRHASHQLVQTILTRLHFSRRRQRRIRLLLQYMDLSLALSDRALRRMIDRRIPVEGVFRLIKAKASSCRQVPANDLKRIQDEYQRVMQRCRVIRTQMEQLHVKDLALSGGEVADMVRLPPGPWIRQVQSYLVEWVGTDMRRNKRDTLQLCVREWIVQHAILSSQK